MAYFNKSLFIIQLCFVLITTILISTCHADNKYQYGIMIDAGSSGSRSFIYRWDPRTMLENNTFPVSYPISQVGWSYKVSVPVASYAEKTDQIGTYFDDFLLHTKEIFSSQIHETPDFSTVPIYFGATAGLRLLAEPQRSNLMTAIRNYFQTKSGFHFHNHFAKILSGEEEGFFGFVAVNYLSQNLFDKKSETLSNNQLEVTTKSVYGALDMGGASTQITFAPDHDILEGYYEYITPNDIRYELYTTSYLNFGLDQYNIRVLNAITKSATSDVPVSSPCHNTGYNLTYYNPNTSINVTINGNYDKTKCHDIIANDVLLLNNVVCLAPPCAINGRYQPTPPKNTIFTAFNGFYFTLQYYTEPGILTVSDIATIQNKICSLSWDELDEQYPKVDHKYLSNACSYTSYFSTLLHDAYQLEDSATLLVADKINNTDVSWALGRMVYEVNLLAVAAAKNKISTNNSIFLLVFGTMLTLLLVLVVLLWYVWKTASASKNATNGNDILYNDPLLNANDKDSTYI